eukprot:tig00000882_g5252.t1
MCISYARSRPGTSAVNRDRTTRTSHFLQLQAAAPREFASRSSMKIFACFEACSPARVRLAILDEAPREFASRSSMKIFACFEACSPARVRLAILDEAPREFASRSSMKIFACFEACSPARLRLAILDEDLCLPRALQPAASRQADLARIVVHVLVVACFLGPLSLEAVILPISSSGVAQNPSALSLAGGYIAPQPAAELDWSSATIRLTVELWLKPSAESSNAPDARGIFVRGDPGTSDVDFALVRPGRP